MARSRSEDDVTASSISPVDSAPVEKPKRGELTIQQSGRIIGAMVAVLWAIEIIDTIVNHRFDRYGVQPRTLSGLRGIPLAPLLHANFRHLIGNTIPLAAMGWLVLVGGVQRLVRTTVVIVVVSGMGMWLFGGSNTVHLGASGVVFGYLGYLLLRGVFSRKIGQIALGLLVLVLYGGLIWGLLPTPSGVSWQGHLFGLFGGILVARIEAQPSVHDETSGKVIPTTVV